MDEHMDVSDGEEQEPNLVFENEKSSRKLRETQAERQTASERVREHESKREQECEWEQHTYGLSNKAGQTLTVTLHDIGWDISTS